VQSACERRLVRFMQAREFYEQWPFIFLFKLLRVIPVNRTGNDTASIRTALRTLDAGGCIGIFPEGRISDDGQIHEARKGAALLALMSNAAVVPAYIHGTGRFAGMVRDFFRLDRVTIFFGEPIRFDDLAGRQREEAVRDMALKRIMKGIIDLRDASAAPAARPSGLSADVR
jgi:1-acyl-sn-glycerol-3-phosphate acyltransferase